MLSAQTAPAAWDWRLAGPGSTLIAGSTAFFLCGRSPLNRLPSPFTPSISPGAQTATCSSVTLRQDVTFLAGAFDLAAVRSAAHGIAPEFEDFDVPALGSSDNMTVWRDTRSGLSLTTPGYNTENYHLGLDGSVPEPATPPLFLAGLVTLALLAGLSPRPARDASTLPLNSLASHFTP